MARLTEAQRIEQDNEQQALAWFERALDALPDPRRRQGTRYPLRSVVGIALMAMVCGSDDAEAMEEWGKTNAQWLAGLFDLPHGAPTQDVFLSVFAALDPGALGGVARAWAGLMAVRLGAENKHIAIDGKTSRRSGDAANGQPALHTVSAFMSEAGLVLGQFKTDCKSNEITAIPELLRLLDLRRATVTIDAMGCQSDIAKVIVQRGGHYLLAVKDNQPTLRQDIETTFAEAADERKRTVDEQPRPMLQVVEHVDKGHGRVEKRTVELCQDLSWLSTVERWPSASFVAQVTRERTVLTKGESSTERAYYIGSDPKPQIEQVAQQVRRHWSIENSLHWVLDMGFREDEARHRARNTAQNMTTLRHMALNIVKQDKNRKLGVANSRKRAGWDRSYLTELFVQAGA